MNETTNKPNVTRVVFSTSAGPMTAVQFNDYHRLLGILDRFPYFLGRLDNVARDYECRVLVLEPEQLEQLRGLFEAAFGQWPTLGGQSLKRRTSLPLDVDTMGRDFACALAEEFYARDPVADVRLARCPLCGELLNVQCRRNATCDKCKAWWPIGCGYLEGGRA